ncbi:MAG TPA: polyribonucleotide nucleotidyltransferase [Candidatus Limnocylindrales bacterium]|nr:polyribonucleotide nucleotidyltransferase [Candidatus Limnocylindrales bacterium]
MRHEVALEIGGRRLVLETGRIAKQAHGAVVVSYNDTVVLVTAVSQDSPREGVDFFPLTVEYQEKAFAAGKIPGGFFKREGRPGADEILTCRCIDRPIRPLFPEGYRNETQIIATVLSADRAGAPDVISLIGSSAALHISDIPFGGPIGGVRVGRLSGKLIANPTVDELEACDINLLVAAKRDSIVMVEGGAQQVPEDELLEALYFGHEQIIPIIDMQEELRRLAGQPKREFTAPTIPEDVLSRVREIAEPLLRKAYSITVKQERYAQLEVAKKEFKALIPPELSERMGEVGAAYGRVKEDIVRGDIVTKGLRVDGRDLHTVRPIAIECGFLPRTHGSALFTRGETQAIVVATLGTSADEQRIDSLLGDTKKRFMLHYNFPPYSVGEAKMLRSAGRREIGHGALAERAVSAVLPSPDEFPYTLRVVSEITESNGSSSMATVCGASLSLMDAGVPIKAAVAGVAMGLIAENDGFYVLTDILGDEDHLGDMDFKIAGTEKGITAVQMDIKVEGLPREVMRDAVHKARTARLHILAEMAKALPQARDVMSIHAPRIETIRIHPDKIRDLIGPGGKVIRGIVDQTGCKIDVSDDGTVLVASSDGEAMQRALDIIHGITASPEVGRIYHGTVRRITDFGAFVEILPGTDGLLHISQLEDRRVESVRDVVKEGDKIPVKVLEVDRQGKIRLSLKEARREMAEKEQASGDNA